MSEEIILRRNGISERSLQDADRGCDLNFRRTQMTI